MKERDCMEKVHLSKSKYCKAKQCNKILWLNKYKPGELARKLFGEYINIEYQSDLSKMIEQTKQYIEKKPNIITEASFDYNKNFCSVDILKNDMDGLEIYEVKSSTAISDIYLDDISYQVYILLNLGYKVKKASIVYINSQ